MAVEYKDYDKTLGVSKTATKEEVSKAFKKLARKYHPDLNPGDATAEGKFKEINEAHEVLKDPEKRKLYDQLGPNWEQYQQSGGGFRPPPGYENVRFNFGGGAGGGQAGDFSDFFETIFGGGFSGQSFGGQSFGGQDFGGQRFSRRPRRGSDSEAVYELSLEEAYRGGTKSVTLQEHSTGPGGTPRLETKTLDVQVPAGIKDGQRIRLAGQGNPGSSGGGAGDLYLRIRIRPHHLYNIQENNLVLDLPLAPWEAVLGAKVRVPTLDGPVEMNIPPGVDTGKKLRVRGRGLGSGAKKGDQLVRIVIKAPAELTDAERELWRKLAETSTFQPRDF
ncbi:MAG: DnaJ C-terminal domain-containing protein [Desulfovibrionaceae bacterium]